MPVALTDARLQYYSTVISSPGHIFNSRTSTPTLVFTQSCAIERHKLSLFPPGFNQ